jgi:iron complex outermembrane receptor protein
MKSFVSRTVWVALACASVGVRAQAVGVAEAAADAPASPAAVNSDDEKILREVMVTARKRSESLQQVPMSVTSLDAGELDARGIDQLDDLAAAVPGLQQGDLAITSRLSLRGVNSGDNNAFEQAVGVFVDGVYRGRMNQQHLGYFDMERIEVLKGPQVALYGNSSIGGAISAVTRKPRFEFGGEAQLGYETEYQATRFQGGADLPVSEDLALRLAGTWLEQDRGLAPNQASGQSEPRDEHHAVRLSGLWTASDTLSVGFRHEQGSFERLGHIFDVFKHVDGLGNPWPDSPFTGLNDGRLDIGNGAPFVYQDAFLEADLDESALELNYDGSAFTVTSISALSRYDYRHSADVDLTPATVINVYQDERYRQFSQELRISGDATPALSYLAGVYYQSDDFRNDYLSDFNLPALVAPAFGITPDLAGQLLSPFSRHILLDQEGEQTALFGHLDWALSDRFTAGLGLRYQRIRKQADQAVRGAGLDHVDSVGALVDVRWLNPQLAPILLTNPQYLADPTGYVLVLPDGTRVAPVLAPNHLLGYQIVSAGVGVPHEFVNLSRRETHPMLEASLAWQAAPDLMYFARWSNGAKAGGFDFLYEGGDPDEAEYGDENAKVFELGMKRDWNTVRLNLAAFYGRYDDLQVSVYDGGIGFTVGNAANSTSKGVEGELLWQITPQWRMSGQFAYVDFRYRDFPDANCSTTERLNTGAALCDWSGRRTPFVPELEAGVALSHVRELGSWILSQQLRWGYKGRHATASDNEQQTMQSAYSLLDYRLDLQAADSPWALAAYARNLADKHYNVFTSVIPLAPGGAFAYVRGRGRELGLELRYRF